MVARGRRAAWAPATAVGLPGAPLLSFRLPDRSRCRSLCRVRAPPRRAPAAGPARNGACAGAVAGAAGRVWRRAGEAGRRGALAVAQRKVVWCGALWDSARTPWTVPAWLLAHDWSACGWRCQRPVASPCLPAAVVGPIGRCHSLPLSCRRWLLLLRGCLGLGAITSLYAAVQYLPLADVATITFLAPVFVAAAAPPLLGERAGRGVALAMPLSLLGVVFVSRPTFLFGAGAAALSLLGVTIAVTQAAFSAAAKLTIRSLGATEPAASIILSMAMVSTTGSAALCVLLPGQLAAPRGAAAWALLASTGLLGVGVQVRCCSCASVRAPHENRNAETCRAERRVRGRVASPAVPSAAPGQPQLQP